jgi:hypothetical protein
VEHELLSRSQTQEFPIYLLIVFRSLLGKYISQFRFLISLFYLDHFEIRAYENADGRWISLIQGIPARERFAEDCLHRHLVSSLTFVLLEAAENPANLRALERQGREYLGTNPSRMPSLMMKPLSCRAIIATVVSSLLLSSIVSCRKAHEPEGYRVVGYDAASEQWTIIRSGTFDGKYLTKKLVVTCNFYQWGEHKAVEGPDACHLEVGRLIVPNHFVDDAHRNEFIDVYEMPDEVLSIIEGNGANQVTQQFKILSYTLVSQ